MILILVFGCSSETPQYDSINVPHIDLKLVLELKDDDDFYFGFISDVVVASDGSILVIDASRQRIHIFNSNGKFIKSALRNGRGPGEVQRIYWYVGFTGQDELLVYDLPQQRISIFEFIGDDLRVRDDVYLALSPNYFHLTEDGIMAVHSTEQENDRIVLVNLDGTIEHESFIEFEKNEQMVINNWEGVLLLRHSTPHHGRNIFRFYEDKLIYNRSTEMGFTIYDLNSGDIIQHVSLKRPDYPLTIEQRREYVDDLIERAKLEQVRASNLELEIPATKGKVKNLHYDSIGTIWLNIIDDDGPEWLIFSIEGDLIGSFNENLDGEILRIHNRKIFVKTEGKNGSPILKIFEYNIN